MTYTGSEVQDKDSCEESGSVECNWKTLFLYYLKSEHSSQLMQLKLRLVPHMRMLLLVNSGLRRLIGHMGFLTPVSLTLSTRHTRISVSLGYHIWESARCAGITYGQTLSTASSTYEYTTRAYHSPITTRPDSKISSSTIAHKIVWARNSGSALAIASGVEISKRSGEKQMIQARREATLYSPSTSTA